MQTIKFEPSNTGYDTDYTHSGRIALDNNTEVLVDRLASGQYRLQVIYQTPCQHGTGMECSEIGTMTVTPRHERCTVAVNSASVGKVNL